MVRELQAVLSVYLGIMVEGSVTGLSAVAIPAILRCSTSMYFWKVSDVLLARILLMMIMKTTKTIMTKIQVIL